MTVGSDDPKRVAALSALAYVRDEMVVGLGSGSTAEMFVAELGERVRAGLRVVGVPTSRKTEALARRLGVRLADLDDHQGIDVTIDGADEIDARTFHVIKGRGGSLLREKLVAAATNHEIIIADDSKLASTLGERQPVPVEVVRFGWRRTAEALKRLGCEPTLRSVGGAPVVSDEGHHILDCRFPPIHEPEQLAREIKAIIGVVEHGLFIGLVHRLVIASRAGVKIFERGFRG
jgi:ribose 5-phosphate isomerase A